MDMLHFEASVGGIKWLTIAIFSYYEPYKMSVGDALMDKSHKHWVGKVFEVSKQNKTMTRIEIAKKLVS